MAKGGRDNPQNKKVSNKQYLKKQYLKLLRNSFKNSFMWEVHLVFIQTIVPFTQWEMILLYTTVGSTSYGILHDFTFDLSEQKLSEDDLNNMLLTLVLRRYIRISALAFKLEIYIKKLEGDLWNISNM